MVARILVIPLLVTNAKGYWVQTGKSVDSQTIGMDEGELTDSES